MEKEPNALGGNSSLLAIPEEYTLLYIGRTWIDPKDPMGNCSTLSSTAPPLKEAENVSTGARLADGGGDLNGIPVCGGTDTGCGTGCGAG
mmetsp:Transcript_4235/g.6757  ORF Transcript_4235/g.6757 Transcript_4235/m.6757 type:complete len:90 (+) Transcript_4235:172-441(+)